MKKNTLILFLTFFITSSSFGQSTSLIEYRNAHNQLVSSKEQAAYYRVIVLDKEDPNKASFTDYYISGDVHNTGFYSSMSPDKRTKDGLWITYYKNGQKQSEETYREGTQNGLFTNWHENGQKKSEETYIDGKRIGTSRDWYENGQLRSETREIDAQNSIQSYWYENGQLKMSIPYVRLDLKWQFADGKIIVYAANGKIKRESVLYQNNEIENTCYDSTGAVTKCMLPFTEIMPEFPGGIKALYNYLSKNIRYPRKASKEYIQGRVFIAFVVEKDGMINDVQVSKGLSPEIDAEAVRVVATMPAWKPASQFGEFVPVRFSLPITFSLNRR